MEAGQAKDLRDAWITKGNLPCTHGRLDAESSASGYFTGQYVCKSCGAYVEVADHSVHQEPRQKRPMHWSRYALYTSMGFLAAAVPVFAVWYKRKRHEPEKQGDAATR